MERCNILHDDGTFDCGQSILLWYIAISQNISRWRGAKDQNPKNLNGLERVHKVVFDPCSKAKENIGLNY